MLEALEIITWPDPRLKKISRPVAEFTPELAELAKRMFDLMRLHKGVGLAAPQVGQPLRLAVIEDQVTRDETERAPVPFHVIVNPELRFRGQPAPRLVDFFEGCLSVDGYQAIVPRAREVTVTALDHRGEAITIDASGWYARILQHEIDHLNGVLYIDRMHTRTFSTGDNLGAHWPGQSPAEILAALGASI
jgi:peptide deformylase